MTWFLAAISGYFFLALASVFDKFLLRQRATTNPLVYVFFISLLSVFTFVLAPFGLHWPGQAQFWLAIFAGIIFFLGVYFSFKSLDDNDASCVLPIIGGSVPVFVLFFSAVFLGEFLGFKQIIAFILLVFGGVLISFKKGHKGILALKDLGSIFLAILFNSAYMVLAKYLFESQGFISGFIWTRLGMIIAALAILFWPTWRRLILRSSHQATAGLNFMLIGNKVMAGVGSVLVNWAISLGSVSLINALRGLEYAFLLLVVILLSKRYPHLLEEKLNATIIFQKGIAVLLMAAGLAVLAF
jgi:drug/metabolite transporter (DMT)-like permease